MSLLFPGVDSWLKIVCFKKGGHYCFKKHSDVVNNEIGKLLLEISRKLEAKEIDGQDIGNIYNENWSDAEFEDEHKQQIRIRAKN